MQYKVLVTDEISDNGLQCLMEHSHFFVDKRIGLPPAEIKGIIKNYDALIVRSQTQVTEEVLHNAGRLGYCPCRSWC